jgi:hypothetical protein
VIDMDEQYMCLHTNATADQLWERWELLRELLDKIGQDMALASDRWNEATDPVARQELWVAFEVASRESCARGRSCTTPRTSSPPTAATAPHWMLSAPM